MTELFKLVGVITVDGLKPAIKGIRTLEKDVKKAIRPVVRFGKELEQVGTSLTRNLTVPLVAAGVAAFKAGQIASDLNETLTKTGEIFDDSADDIIKWADTAATKIGQSKQQAMDAAGTFGIFGSSAGLAGKELVDFSTQFSELASDFASFYNTSPQDAIVAIGAALRGENEPIRRYGILLDDATLRQKALEEGIVSTIKNALTPQQKVLAASKVIMEQSTKAQGDFARTSEGFANQMRIAKAEVQDLAANLGQTFLPIMLDLTKIFRESFMPMIQKAVEWWKGLSEEARETTVKVAAFVALIGPAILIISKLVLSVKMVTTALLAAKLAVVALNATLLANPYIAIAAAVIGISVAVVKLTKDYKNLNKTIDENRKKFAESLDEKRKTLIVGALQEIIFHYKRLSDMDKRIISDEEYLESKNAIENLRTTLGDFGIELNQQVRPGLRDAKAALDQYVTKTKEATGEVDDNTVAVKKNTEAVEDNSEKRFQAIMKDIGDYRAQKEAFEKEDAEELERKKQNEDTIYQIVRDRMDKIRARRAKNTAEIQRGEEAAIQREKELNQFKINAAYQVYDIISSLNQNASIAVENNYKKQRKAIENSTKSEEEKAAALQQLDDKTDKKRMAIRKRQAVADKAAAIFSIAINTAVAITKALPNLVLSAIVGGLGLIQAGVVAAKPVPQLAEGAIAKKRAGGTLVNVGEGNDDEAIIPMRSGAANIAEKIVGNIKRMTNQAPSTQGGLGGTKNVYITNKFDNFITDNASLKKFSRIISKHQNYESTRLGAVG